MTERRYEVEAAVNSIVDDVPTVQSTFIAQESLVLLIDVFENGTEAIRIVDRIPEAWGVYNGQSQLDTALLNLNRRCVEL